MLKLTLLSLLAISTPLLAQSGDEKAIDDLCKTADQTRADVFIEFTGSIQATAKVPTPANVLLGFHLEKSFCKPWLTIGLTSEEIYKANSKPLESTIKGYNATAHAAPYYFKEAEVSLPKYDAPTFPLYHKAGSESYARSDGVACAAEGYETAIEHACRYLAGSSGSREYKANYNAGIAQGNKNLDAMWFEFENYGPVTVTPAECKATFTEFFKTYTWTSEDKKSNNVTGGWTYSHDGNLKSSFYWQSGHVEVKDKKFVSFCAPGPGNLTSGAVDIKPTTDNKTTTTADAKVDDADKGSGAGAGKEVWGSLIALAGLVAVVLV